MADFFETHSYRVGGGLNLADAPEQIEPDDALVLENVRITGLGRWTFGRRSLAEKFSGIVNPVGVHRMPHGSFVPAGESEATAIGAVILDWTGTAVNLYAVDGEMRHKLLIGTLAGWDNVGTKPKTIAAVMGGALWIVDEGREHGLTCYDPNLIYKQPGVLFQPKFKFQQNTASASAPIRARTVATYHNMLWVAGYGDEDDTDRPEILRHSYINFTPDPQTVAGGDAAYIPNPDYLVDASGEVLTPDEDEFILVDGGVPGLFAVDDGFPVGTRGIPIVGLKAGAQRMIVGGRFEAFTLYGFDRLSFQLDLIDNERGVVNGRAIGEADGVVYWYSPLGPCRYVGGAEAEPLERKVHDLLVEFDEDTIWFLHQPLEYEARWYFSSDGGEANRALCFNYRYAAMRTDTFSFRLAHGDAVQPGTILEPPTPGAPILFPLTAPVRGPHRNVLSNQATATWANGETGPGITTEYEYKKQADPTWIPVPPPLAAGVSEFTVVGLEGGVVYEDRVRHVHTDSRTSAWATASFTTATDTDAGGPPQNLRAILRVVIEEDGATDYSITVDWDNGTRDAFTTVEARNTDTGEVRRFFTEFINRSRISRVIEGLDEISQPWMFRARHSSEINDGGTLSAWTDEVPVSESSVSYPDSHSGS